MIAKETLLFVNVKAYYKLGLCFVPLIPVLGKLRQTDLCEVMSTLVYMTNSKPTGTVY